MGEDLSLQIGTDLRNLCMTRVMDGKQPACVHHCMTKCMAFGPIEEMAKLAAKKKKSVVWGKIHWQIDPSFREPPFHKK